MTLEDMLTKAGTPSGGQAREAAPVSPLETASMRAKLEETNALLRALAERVQSAGLGQSFP